MKKLGRLWKVTYSKGERIVLAADPAEAMEMCKGNGIATLDQVRSVRAWGEVLMKDKP